MSERLENRAEVSKLARLLAVEPAELAFLEPLPASAVHEYRERATDRLFDADAAMFRRLGAAAGLVPTAVVASVAQHAFGPLLSARTAGSLETAKALDVLKRLSPDFLAEAAVEVDPRRIAALIAEIPHETVAEVARRLAEEHEYVTMGRFLGYLPDEAIVRSMNALSDEALLETAFVLEHKERLDHAVSLLPGDRLAAVLECASRLDLWPEALDLLDHLSERQRGPIAELVALLNPSAVEGLVAAVSRAGIWDSLLPIVRLMSEPSLHRLLSAPAFHDPAILAEIIAAMADAEAELQEELVPLLWALPADAQATAMAIVAEQDPARLEQILAARDRAQLEA